MNAKAARQKLALRKAFSSKKKITTESSRRHHFEGFTTRIQKLKIDPVRRVRIVDDDASKQELASHFRNALEKWRETNLSEDFSNFSREVGSLCDNLPQVLHHQDKILDLLLGYIEKGNTVAVEPLLDLVPRLAQDIQTQFQRHFERAIKTVSHLAAKHPEPEVVEWSFNCLAWLFKYLERLLIPNLCPTYDLLAPLLGKERQKTFVARFAAEALSFLLKKASKTPDYVTKVVRHALDDLCQTAEINQAKGTDLYEQGLTSLFVEATNGVQRHLHSRGDTIFGTLLSEVSRINESSTDAAPAIRVLRGVLVSVINHTTPESFKPVLEIISRHTSSVRNSLNVSKIVLSTQLIFLLVAVRNGTRVTDWPGLLATLFAFIQHVSQQGPSRDAKTSNELLATFAVAHQACSLEIALSHVKVFDELCSPRWQQYFLGFSSLYSELGNDRFRSLLLPYFQRFIAKRWDGSSRGLSLLLPQMVSDGRLVRGSLKIPRSWQTSMATKFGAIGSSVVTSVPDVEISALNGLLEMSTIVPLEADIARDIHSRIYAALVSFLQSSRLEDPTVQDYLLLGAGFKFIAENPSSDESPELWNLLSSAAPKLQSLPLFYRSLLTFVQTRRSTLHMDESENSNMLDSLIECLSSASHKLRLAALEILQTILPSEDAKVTELITSAIGIEQTKPSLETARWISMQLLNMGMAYRAISTNQYMARIVPSFCFGLLHVKYAQIVEDACVALKEICNSKEGEQIVCEIAFAWLEGSDNPETETLSPEQSEEVAPPLDGDIRFGGSGFERVQTLVEKNLTRAPSFESQLDDRFQKTYSPIRLRNKSNRSHGLKVLKTVPQVAEKRSRSLVPVLLSWALQPQQDMDAEILPDVGQDLIEDTQPCGLQRWERKDQKSLLSIFALFFNPKVLYRATDVYAALLSLLEHGDAEIQTSALRAIFTWKNSRINRYQEELLKFLDDARFREQLTVFLDGSDSLLRREDRADLMPIILRLLYGRVITRTKGADQRTTRRAVFVVLSRFPESEVHQFIDIALGSIRDFSLIEDGRIQDEQLNKAHLPQRRQLGLLNMLKDLLDAWKSTATPYVPRLVDPVFYVLVRATRQIISATSQEEDDADSASKDAFARSLRQVALIDLNLLFSIGVDFDWKPYLPTLFHVVINPRLKKLASETAQGVSGMLRIFSTWAHSPQLAPALTEYNPILLSTIAESIGFSSARAEVKRFVVNDVLGALIELAANSADGDEVVKHILKQCADSFLVQLAILLGSDPPKDLMEDAVAAISGLSVYTSDCPVEILSCAADLLQLPSKIVSHKIKGELLYILLHFFSSLRSSAEAREKVFSATCASFAFFTDGESRTLLSQLVRQFSEDEDVGEVADLCEDLNSFISGRLDLPDFDRRARAFTIINEEKFATFSVSQWRLLLGNLMFYVKDVDELSIRLSASHGLQRFAEAASSKTGSEKEEFMKMLKDTVLVAVEKGLRVQPELVKAEFLTVLSHIVRKHPDWNAVSDMHCLLDGDEESSFFVNALHIQKERRILAMKRLSEEIKLGRLSANSLYHLLLPLLEYFTLESGDSVVAGEAGRTIGTLVEWIDWQQCRALLRRYIGYVQSKPDIQNTILKLMDAVTISICHSADIKVQRTSNAASSDPPAEGVAAQHSKLSKTMPGPEKMSQYLLTDVLPPLSRFLHDKDEALVSRRVNIAVIATRYMKLLSEEEFGLRFSPLLTDVCNILKSMDQDSRDITRRALSTMCRLVGPSSIGFVLRELKTALQRGFYLHVLSYTVHAVLEVAISAFKPGDLDYCASDIVAIVMEDVFGNIGLEKDAKDYKADKNTKKEVKGQKSFDSLQLLASVTSLEYISDLVRPVEMLLMGSLKHRDIVKIDELLRRLELGLLQNVAVHDRAILVFCYQLIHDSHKPSPSRTTKPKDVPNKYLVRDMPKYYDGSLQRKKVAGRITRFALDLFRSVLKKYKDLATPANIEGFMDVIGDSLVSDQEDVKLAAIRLFTVVLNVPIKRIDKDTPVYVAEAARVIEESHAANDELSQAALKLISSVLRERKSAPVKIKEKTVAVLLKKMRPDLQVISKQGAAFNLLSAIISRKIIVPEVYEMIDGDEGVAAISVRDHDRSTRDHARRVYFQFLMEYPQGKGRFAKQLTFLVRNLEFIHAEGRQSVMETLLLLLNKVGDTLAPEVIQAAFWPLVSVLVNDDSSDCREGAAVLVKKALERGDEEWLKSFIVLIGKLLGDDTRPIQKRTALQCWTLYLEVKGEEAKGVSAILRSVQTLLDEDSEDFTTEEWQQTYYALHTMLLLCKHLPGRAFANGLRPVWIAVRNHLTYPQAWVKQEAAKLIGALFADFKNPDLSALPLESSHDLQLDDNELCDLAAKNLRLLRDGVTLNLATQAVQNLAFLGRCFAANGMQWRRVFENPSTLDGDKEEAPAGDEDQEEAEAADGKEGRTAIAHLFYRLATILRREPKKPRGSTEVFQRRAETLNPNAAALTLISSLCATISTESLVTSMDTILLPLVHLTDRTITPPSSGDPSFGEAWQDLVTKATELMDMLSTKLGTTEYVKALQRVKRQVSQRRDERRQKRKIEAVSMPEKTEKVKQRKREAGKVRRKEIGGIERGKRRGW
ncbi:HEAT repeat protein-like protein [Venturia nashicola]|uniref:HEAT repeat protein-like protein n=1 Tax=Venturia nashicola TaxID=86259 RepID=A0A4Z1PG94_9PEZI|nr:HEAT repeat protein-like protein [Venturia nashicola]